MAATTEAIAEFQQNGVICLRNVFGDEWLAKVTEGIKANLAAPSELSENLKGHEGEGHYFNDLCNWQRIGQFQDFAFHSPAAELAGKLMESKYAVFYHEHVLIKEAETGMATPWHQDQPYYPIDGFKNCSIWMPIDPVAEELTIQFVKGSHRWGKWFYPRKFATTNNYTIIDDDFHGKTYESVPSDIETNPENYEILQWEVNPGDCVIFHMRTLHGALPNKSDAPRRVLVTRWLGDDATLASRPWEVVSPELGGLQTGDPVVCSTFPMVWQAKPEVTR